ncbi:MAG: PD-(D/E)XK nuclease family protein [Candidatus Aenigmatarchaeota archaeon]
MKKEIREIINQKGEKIIQITTYDERWYAKPVLDETTGMPRYEFYPSVTWITSSGYPKGIGFMKWLAQQGWDEAQALGDEASARGYKIHCGAGILLSGKELSLEDKLPREWGDPEPEEIKPDEWEAFLSLKNWVESLENFEVVAVEYTAFNEKEKYAGTIDLICRIDGQLYLIDLKTSKEVWPEHELQLSAYANLEVDLKELKITEEEWKNKKLAILQIGYNRNQKGWKLTEVQEQYDLFLAVKKIWEKEHSEDKPEQKEYPLTIKIEKLCQKKNNNKKK